MLISNLLFWSLQYISYLTSLLYHHALYSKLWLVTQAMNHCPDMAMLLLL